MATKSNIPTRSTTPVDRLVDRHEVLARTNCCRTTLWKMIRDGKFPPPRKTGLRHARWLESDLESYFHSLSQEIH